MEENNNQVTAKKQWPGLPNTRFVFAPTISQDKENNNQVIDKSTRPKGYLADGTSVESRNNSQYHPKSKPAETTKLTGPWNVSAYTGNTMVWQRAETPPATEESTIEINGSWDLYLNTGNTMVWQRAETPSATKKSTRPKGYLADGTSDKTHAKILSEFSYNVKKEVTEEEVKEEEVKEEVVTEEVEVVTEEVEEVKEEVEEVEEVKEEEEEEARQAEEKAITNSTKASEGQGSDEAKSLDQIENGKGADSEKTAHPHIFYVWFKGACNITSAIYNKFSWADDKTTYNNRSSKQYDENIEERNQDEDVKENGHNHKPSDSLYSIVGFLSNALTAFQNPSSTQDQDASLVGDANNENSD